MTTNVIEINQENILEKINENDVCLVDVWAPWCGPCKQLLPVIEEVSSETLGKCMIFKLNADENMNFCKEMNIRNIPTMLVYKSNEVVERLSGFKTKKEILDTLENYY